MWFTNPFAIFPSRRKPAGWSPLRRNTLEAAAGSYSTYEVTYTQLLKLMYDHSRNVRKQRIKVLDAVNIYFVKQMPEVYNRRSFSLFRVCGIYAGNHPLCRSRENGNPTHGRVFVQ